MIFLYLSHAFLCPESFKLGSVLFCLPWLSCWSLIPWQVQRERSGLEIRECKSLDIFSHKRNHNNDLKLVEMINRLYSYSPTGRFLSRVLKIHRCSLTKSMGMKRNTLRTVAKAILAALQLLDYYSTRYCKIEVF